MFLCRRLLESIFPTTTHTFSIFVLLVLVAAPSFCYFAASIGDSSSFWDVDACPDGHTELLPKIPHLLSWAMDTLFFFPFSVLLHPTSFLLFAALFSLALSIYWYAPGTVQEGPITKTGHLPVYKDNALFHFFTVIAAFLLFSDAWLPGRGSSWAGYFSATIFVDLFFPFVHVLNVVGIMLCLVLYVKGMLYPSTEDSGTTGRGILFDFYWGTDLYPKILSIDVKHFVNCRISMTIWMLTTISCLYASLRRIPEDESRHLIDLGVIGSCILQIIYLFKFYWWEMGYLRSLDIIEDRAGFYETWGCLVWVPAIYTLHTRIAAIHSTIWTVSTVSPFSSFGSTIRLLLPLLVFFVGICGIVFNYIADRQRQEFRAQKAANIPHRSHPPNIWFLNQCPRYIQCFYEIEKQQHGAKSRDSSCGDGRRLCAAKLVISGFWGLVRHPQYIFELVAAFSWCVLCLPTRDGPLGFKNCWHLFGDTRMTMFYPIYLTILLIHRAGRDEKKCLQKYGEGYEAYKIQVPYHMVPFVF